ncbi:MAG: hypothetical protein H0T45_14130 [Pyrinomonadaceae bacterium]|nr:hypothetical protein [Pyrinomonadaceae bacterium]
MRQFLHNNSLSVVLFALFFFSLLGQSLTGHHELNQEQQEHGRPVVSFAEYLTTGHFVEAVFENWESEFLQMAVYVVFTVFLFQKGSAESKDPDRIEPVDQDPARMRDRPDVPWPVRRGGLALTVYSHSLSLALLLLFVMSFVLHAAGGAAAYSQEQQMHGQPPVTMIEYLGTSRFWFESFQNWQSEFLSMGAVVVLSIFLRERGSPESKPVHSPHDETGNS